LNEGSGLGRSRLFTGLSPAEIDFVVSRAHNRIFKPGEPLCRAGEPSDRCWVITSGLVDVLGGDDEAVVARQRKGATIGEVATILADQHQETVVASIRTTALELSAADLAEVVQRFPRILVNVLRTTHDHLAQARARSAERELGETVAVAAGPSLRGVLARLVATAQITTPRSVTALDRELSFAGALTAADDLVSAHATVLLAAELDAGTIDALMREADRVVALAGNAEEAAGLAELRRADGLAAEVEVVLVGPESLAASRDWSPRAPLRVIRTCSRGDATPLFDADLWWLARHLTRTKLGLALGAGGAKGYAHIGVLQVLEEAGYRVDCVAGSSIGAVVGTHLALGLDAEAIDRTLRQTFSPEAVAEIFKPSLSGRASGLELMTRLLRETTSERTFADTVMPLTVMAVDLSARAPAPLREGPLWEALLSATALAGVFPPHERDGHRLVDGLALVPVPTGAVIDDGADVTVSVNLIGPETLPAWPGGPPPEPPPERRRRGVLDNLLEVMDLSQMADSVWHTELADVPITPTFGPGEWRDFHLADLFLEAGRVAASQQLPELQSRALPAQRQHQFNDEGASIDRAGAVRV
jgi:predicted acylesterase/phospholipase RssA/CRP-like cAMP-binding protein